MNSKFDFSTKVWHGPQFAHPYPMDYMFGELIYQNLCEDSERVLQVNESDDSELKAKDLRLASVRVAQNLIDNGIKADDVVGMVTHQSHFSTAFITGCVFMGAILNPLDASLSESDIRHVFIQSKPKIIVCDSECISKIEKVLADVDFDYTIFSTSESDSNYESVKKFQAPTGKEENFSVPKFSQPCDEKILAIMCSSGTTGAPKGVSVTHANCFIWLPLRPMEQQMSISLCFSPLYWSSGFFRCLTAPLAKMSTQIITRRSFSVETFIEIVERYAVTCVSMPPSQLAALLNSPAFLASNASSIRTFTVVGAILSKTLREKFEQIFPTKLLMIPYGMTEVSVSVTKPLDYKHEFCVGSILFPNVQVKIVDDDGVPLDNGQRGEICAKPFFKFLGYYNNPEATANAVDNEGFFKSGDIGYFNEEGMLFVVDRKKEIVKYKGYHINPSEIENVIQAIEGVVMVSVVGVPDDFCYNLLTAAVVKQQGFDKLAEKDIIARVSSALPEYKHLHGGVYFFDKLPMTPSGKVQKRAVLENVLKIKHQ